MEQLLFGKGDYESPKHSSQLQYMALWLENFAYRKTRQIEKKKYFVSCNVGPE